MAAITEDATTIPSRAALSLSAPNAVDDLLSNGVCIRCVFRLFGVHGDAYSRPSLTASMLWSYLEEPKTSQTSLCEAADNQNGLNSCGSQKSRDKNSYCCICLGILEFSCRSDQETRDSQEGASVVNFTRTITELVKGEGHQIDGFTLEISVPPVVVANERAIWLYMKNKYDSEEWFKEKYQCDHISVKDALRLSITSSLENFLNAKSGVDLFRIRLTYTHVEASAELQSLLAKDHGGKKKKTEAGDCKDTVDDISRRESKNSNGNVQNEPDAVIYRALNGLQNSSFCERFMLPQEKAYKPCHLAITCCRTPIYVGGRYLKLSRKVSQSRWIIDDERMGEDSVEEIIGSSTLLICKGDNYKFHAAGREDIDVRMLGSGRPFLVEVSNARHIPLLVDIQKIEDAINNSDKKYVLVRNLKVVGNDAWALMREGEAEKQKQYAALVWIPRPLSEDDLLKISSIKNMDILQRTPIRVLHRRSPLERTRIIHWMKVEKVAGSCQYFLLHLCTQAGTYIKEFVHGDLGRTHPSIGSLLGCRAEILQLDVTDVKMESFD